MRRFFHSIAAALIFVGATHAHAQDAEPLANDERACTSGFALCTSAPCIPDPTAPDARAICTCEVTFGANYAATTPCADRGPTLATVGAANNDAALPQTYTRVVSTYGFIQSPTKPVMTCNTTAPWTDCLDAPCIVDPKDPLRAICTCPYAARDPDAPETFVTYGGSCNTATCERAVWSAATQEAFEAGSLSLMQYLGIKDPPFTFCPPQSPSGG